MNATPPTQAPPPPSSTTSASPARPSAPPPPASMVWASLVLDLAALVVVAFLGKWHVLNSEVVAASLTVILTGRVVAKGTRGNGPPGSAGFTSLGGVVAVAGSLYGLLYRHHGGA